MGTLHKIMSEDTNDTRAVTGRVKWFDPSKGYGFVVSKDGGPDILLHANVLRNFGQSSVSEGVEVVLTVQTTERGIQAVEVLEIRVPPVEPSGPTDPLNDHDVADLESLPLQPGRVKWFDKVKGFGFANIFGQGDDVFVHIEVLRRSGFADLQSGEAVAMKVAEGKRGRMAVSVSAWEVALRSQER